MADADTKDANGLDIPVAKVRQIIKDYKPSLQLELEAAAAVARSTELFLEALVQHSVTASSTMALGDPAAKKHTLNYDDIAKAIRQQDPFDFLQAIVPERVSGARAKEMRAAVEAKYSRQE